MDADGTPRILILRKVFEPRDGKGAAERGSWPHRLRLLPMLLKLYWKRLQTQLAQEALAVLGIAIGVALIFAVEIANISVPASVRGLYHELAGPASIEVGARSSQGFSEALVGKVGETPGVFGAAGLLDARVTVLGPHGQAGVTLFGAQESFSAIGGALAKRFSLRDLEGATLPAAGEPGVVNPLRGAHVDAIELPGGVARAIGAAAGQLLLVRTSGRSTVVICARVFDGAEVGSAAESPVVIATLEAAQRMTGLAGRVTRVMVMPKRGREAAVMRALRGALGAKLNVRSITTEVALLEEATSSQSQSAAVFTALSLIVGLLFAYNAMLLTLPSRRRWISWLRDRGARRGDLGALVALEVLLVGLAASIVGLALGYLLATLVFGGVPRYLTAGFPIGTQRLITPSAVGLAVGGGLLATALAAAGPTISALRGRPFARLGEGVEAASSLGLLSGPLAVAVGGVAILVTAALALLAPDEGIIAAVTLVVAMASLLPASVPWLVGRCQRLAMAAGSPTASFAAVELRAVPVRATAVAATGALAVAAIVATGGSARDIQRGVTQTIRDVNGRSNAVVAGSGFAQASFQTQPFAGPALEARLAGLPEVQSVSPLREAFLDAGGLRLFVLAKPAADQVPVSASQLIEGSPARLGALLRAGGWAALSSTVADRWHLHLGQRFLLPAPAGEVSLRLAATIGNYGWPAGALVIGAAEFERLWQTSSVTQLNVTFRQGVGEARGVRELRSALHDSALVITPRSAVKRDVEAAARQGMAQLGELATLMLIAAVLASIAVMAGSVWQRRARLSMLARMGMFRSEIVRTIYLETGLVVLIGCLVGLAFGLAGQPIATGYVRQVTGFPQVYAPALWLGVRTLLLATVISTLASGFLGLVVTHRSGVWGPSA